MIIPDSVKSIGVSAFFTCDSLTSITIPYGVTTLEYTVLGDCLYLASVTIPDSVTTIKYGALQHCDSLTSITIPSSVTSIETWAFDRCNLLTDIYFDGTEEQWGKIKFGDYVYDTDKVTVHFNSSAPSAPAASQFTDALPGGAYTKAVEWAVENSYADAASSTAFGTLNPCPRWEVVSILWKALDCPAATITTVPFTDVSPDAPYYKAVLWAYENKIAQGVTPTSFGPDSTVKRCDAMTFIYRAAKEPAVQPSGSFVDVAAGQYFTAPITWAYTNDISNGTDATHFSPEVPVQRGQMVTFLYRYLVENAAA